MNYVNHDKVDIFMCSKKLIFIFIDFFIYIFFSYLQLCLKTHQLKNIKIIKKDYKKNLVKVFLEKKRKKEQHDRD